MDVLFHIINLYKFRMISVKYVLIIKNNNLLKQNVVIVYVMNVLNNWLKIKKLMNAQYVENKIGF